MHLSPNFSVQAGTWSACAVASVWRTCASSFAVVVKMHWSRGKGRMCLSLPHYGVKTQLGQLCGREGAPRYRSVGSHFNASYSPKTLRQRTSSTNPFLSMEVRSGQSKAKQTETNHLALSLLPNLWCPCSGRAAFSCGRLQNNQTPFTEV